MNRRHLIGLTAAGLYIFTIYAANWAINHWGIVPVGFGLSAPAGVYFVGLALTLRDITNHQLGRTWVLASIAAGILLSYWLGNGQIPGGLTSIAVASAVAFAVSELSDMAVYEPIRQRGWIPAVAASNAVGLTLDSVVFLWLAFGSMAGLLPGQLLGKAWMTLAAIGALALIRTRRQEALA
jgi:uncharacterized PurR-regulated membrane protein YhhQ (DUF165 family)